LNQFFVLQDPMVHNLVNRQTFQQLNERIDLLCRGHGNSIIVLHGENNRGLLEIQHYCIQKFFRGKTSMQFTNQFSSNHHMLFAFIFDNNINLPCNKIITISFQLVFMCCPNVLIIIKFKDQVVNPHVQVHDPLHMQIYS
jgi:hypothetical protein